MNKVIIRKHQTITFSTKVPHIKPNIKVPTTRKLDPGKLLQYKHKERLNEKAFHADINTLINSINNTIKQSSLKKKKQYHKPWFDLECKQLKAECIRRNLTDPDYNNKKKEYKKLINSKRTIYTENQLVEKFNCELVQWSLFKKDRPQLSTEMTVEVLLPHFKGLLTSDTSIQLPQNNKEYETWCDDLFTSEEIINVISKTKNRKATGPDLISYEEIKQSIPILETEWELLFNRCLLEGKIPEIWKSSNMYILYKGKGNAADPNNYRGIALQQTAYKCLSKLINNRLTIYSLDKLPNEQHGFIPGRTTITPIGIIVNDVKSEISKKGGIMYACFVDFQKAFDSVDRGLLIQKLIKDFHLGGKTLSLINNILTQNNVHISVGNQTAKHFAQTKGVAQGDGLSPTLFIMYIADLATEIKKGTINLKILMYADDLVIYSPIAEEIKTALNNLCFYCDKNKLKVNIAKTKVIKFRKGGRLAKKDRFLYKGEEVEITNKYTYLGVTLQTKLTLTEHIKNRKIQSVRAINSLKHLTRLKIETAHTLFHQKIKPIVTYALQNLAKLLTANQLQEIDKIKSYFIKKVLGVHKSASNTLCHQIIGWHTLVEDLKSDYNFDTEEILKYQEIRDEKNWNFVINNYTDGPAFTSAVWRQANQNNRSKICRTTIHGFHHMICENQESFHQLCEDCKCKYCQKNCSNRYHLLACNAAAQACQVQ